MILAIFKIIYAFIILILITVILTYIAELLSNTEREKYTFIIIILLIIPIYGIVINGLAAIIYMLVLIILYIAIINTFKNDKEN